MITTHDMALRQDAIFSAPQPTASRLSERILLLTLFAAMLVSSVAFFEPSPYDAMMGLMAFAFLLAGVRFERMIALPLVLLLIWNVAGLIALFNALGNDKAIQYAITSFYLSATTILIACLLSDGSMPGRMPGLMARLMARLAALRTGYIASAVVAALAGISGYFHLFPGSDMFALYGRAMGMFKDPNVFGPYLIWPALFVMARIMTRRLSVRDLLIAGILFAGIFFSFSRGAWMHFAVSAVVMQGLLILSAPSPSARMRLILFSAGAMVAIALVVALLLSIDSIRDMFYTRAQSIQSYDVGQGGRFYLQEIALGALLEFPFGMGPLEFARVYGLQQHNVYLQAFLVYGWVGGFAYLILLAATLFIGLRMVWTQTPWQPYLITAYATLIGEIGEGAIIDTDHWRHFFLLLGMVWGLAAATARFHRDAKAAPS